MRAARALLAWPQRHLAHLSGVPLRTLARIEAGEVTKPRGSTMKRLSAVLREAGVEFIPANGGGPGVRLTREAALREAMMAMKGE
ncbi:helix-turn-helix domain-containing protein [Belnapia moabensis]|uniref:helix-turn-helix domain-containing protein n=1 Tax=Belnapia moabensis TaxID=365533 RepID=UPI0024807233|nr:helix-turn-helix transcriptional regulator [Belnapia moabensis]